MNERAGEVFSISEENQPVPGCTISKALLVNEKESVSYFSLAPDTDISAESYQTHKLIVVLEGELEVYTSVSRWKVSENESVVTPLEMPVGMRTETGCVYLEITGVKEMNQIIKDGTIFSLKDLVPVQEGKIIKMDVINEPALKLVVMSFSAGTGLSEHAAPGEALLLGLEGEGIIGYEGQEHVLHAGESFKFAENGKHYVKAEQNFKMALLLTLK